MALAGSKVVGVEKVEEQESSTFGWLFSRDEIEKGSASCLDGLDLKKETSFRNSYCIFIREIGICLRLPQVTIATAIAYCHRFFLRQSHLRNDRYLIATACLFLAGKAEETTRNLRDVILVAYERQHKNDIVAVQNIKHKKEIYEEQKMRVLEGENQVLTTLNFDLTIQHPYKALVAALKKFKVPQNDMARVAWNFVNDGLRTTLCLQFKPHHIAAGAIFLAAKFLKVKLPYEGDVFWWQEFKVTLRHLEDISSQMLESYTVEPALGLEEDLREKKLSSDFRIKSESGTTLRTLHVKTGTNDEKSITVEGTAVREVTEANASIEETEMEEDNVYSKPEDAEPKKPSVTDIEDVNTARVRALAQKKRKSREGFDLKSAAVKVEHTDGEELLKSELENGVEAAAELEKVKQERRHLNLKTSVSDGVIGKREQLDNGEAGSKRQRHNEDADYLEGGGLEG